MPSIDTTYFGRLDYQPDAVIDFPAGLYAFEDQTRFLLIAESALTPILCLQSLIEPNLSFMTLPVLELDPAYRLTLSEEEAAALGFEPGTTPQIGRDVLCLALITVDGEGHATGNLLAPVVVNHAARRAMQVIQLDSSYSHQHALAPCGPAAVQGEPSCS